MMRLAKADDLVKVRQEILSKRDPSRALVTLCAGTGCRACGCEKVAEAFKKEIQAKGLSQKVELKLTGCHGFCERGPLIVIWPQGIFYQQSTPADVPEIVAETLLRGKVVERLTYQDPVTDDRIPKEENVPFYAKQMRTIFGNNGKLDPFSIEDYVALGGYTALAKALFSMEPEEVIDAVKKSGLRGRGGGGFPAGIKWETCRKAGGEPRYVICNADEGDPGAFMDRSLLEGNPHSVLEGMVIGSYAIGSQEGYIYVRNEYPLAVQTLKKAISEMEAWGLLGDSIMGSGHHFTIKINRGGGAFVCGESTALMASLEGRVGEPRAKYIHTVEHGLWDKPSNLNNVETWANVPLIINQGWEAYAKVGTRKTGEDNPWGGSTGTKIFSLVGKINNTGLIEVPMGITLREIIYGIGGGIPKGRRFKAVQTGGPSGGCLPDRLLDLPVDFDRLTEVGSMMGSGGMIVMDENSCMVDVARYFVDFLKEESCGKCVPCREGLRTMSQVLTRITKGEGKEGDIELLEEIAQVMADSALCALGTSAPNPVLSTIKYFREEYEAHIKDKVCPAAVCRNLTPCPCRHACLLDIDVPGYVGYIARGEFNKAAAIIREELPFPGICGRVCHHPCEIKCRTGETGDPVAIRSLKRFAADYEVAKNIKPAFKKGSPKSEKVAVIGAGPAGLTAAYYLALEGFPVTVFESLPLAGGMLAIGIPDYRLPQKILQQEIEIIKSAGVEVKTGVTVGKDLGFGDLTQQGYKAIFISTGSHKPMKLGIPGEEAQGVMTPIALLKPVNLSDKVKVGSKVAVIGGGNTAMDCARTALRVGAKDVTIVYRRTRAEMPAQADEIEAAIAEGIKIEYLAAPTKVLAKDGKTVGLECRRMRLEGFDSTGRKRPVPIPGSEFTLPVETIIPAVSWEPDLSFLPAGDGFQVTKVSTLAVDPETLQTSHAGVFAGGDAVAGPGTVMEAIAMGKLAARSIGHFLRGETMSKERAPKTWSQVPAVELSEEEIEKMKRPAMPVLSPEKRRGNFEEVDLGFPPEMAVAEAKRCLRCDLVK